MKTKPATLRRGAAVLKLVINLGKDDERVMEITRDVITIGRGLENEVFVLHKSLSRSHARLTREGDGFGVVDLDSRNGTRVRGMRVKRGHVAPGDEFACGEVEFKLVFERERPDFREEPTLVSGSAVEQAEAGIEEVLRDPPERLRRKLSLLAEACRALVSSQGADDLGSDLLGLLFQLFELDRAAVLLWDPITSELVPSALKTSSGEPIDRALLARLARRVRDLSGASRVTDDAVGSAMAAPIEKRGEVLGVLYVDNATLIDLFSEEDLVVFAAFAALATVAVDGA